MFSLNRQHKCGCSWWLKCSIWSLKCYSASYWWYPCLKSRGWLCLTLCNLASPWWQPCLNVLWLVVYGIVNFGCWIYLVISSFELLVLVVFGFVNFSFWIFLVIALFELLRLVVFGVMFVFVFLLVGLVGCVWVWVGWVVVFAFVLVWMVVFVIVQVILV